ncbi:hypothetical protein C8F01DRAFT_948363, partial [Mycena amicta]
AKVCTLCGANKTSTWRRHPQTRERICNACGLSLRHPSQRKTEAPAKCANCGATTSNGHWRRDEKGNHVCSACGKYERDNGTSRPAHLFRDNM